MTQAVTELVVRGDGALATLNRFETSMEKAGIATEHSTGAIADFERRMAAARAAIERGNAITTESVARKTAEQRAWEKWSATVDRTSALRLRLEREAAQASVAAANAVNLGYTTQEQALSTLIALERRHAEQLRAVADQHQSATQATLAHAAANENLAASTQRAAAARDVGNHNVANVAAQFQDIGVTAAMGMSPMMIALQQGTQLSAVLGPQGLTGSVRALGAAFASILSPVSLITIGVVALAAAGIQAFMGLSAANDSTVNSLETHQKKLDELLVGYEAARQAAEDVMVRQTRAPEASVESDLIELRVDAINRAYEAMERALRLRQEFENYVGYGEAFNVPAETIASLQTVNNVIARISEDSALSHAELNQLHTTLTQLANNTADQNIRDIAKEALELVNLARDAATQVQTLDASLRSLPRNITINLRLEQNVQAATDAALQGIEKLRQLAPELRSAREQASAALSEALGAPDALIRTAGKAEYDKTIAALDEQDRRRAADEAERLSRTSGGGAGGSGRQGFSGMVETTQQSIDQLRLQAETMGMTGQAAAALRHEQELLNQAANDNIALSPAQREEIALLAEQYAQAEASLAGVQFALGNPDPWQQAMDNIRNVDAALASGALSWEQYGAAAAKANSGAASAVLGLASQATGALAQMFGDNKAFAVANAVVSTAEAVMKAMATYGPTPWGFAAAGVAAATGAAQIAAIMSAQKGGGSVSRPSGGGATNTAAQTTQAAQRAVSINLTLGGSGRYSRDDIRDLFDQMTDNLKDGVGANFKVAVSSP